MSESINTHQSALSKRWDRLGLSVRCAYSPACPNLIRCYLAMGALLVRRGLATELVVSQQMLKVLLQTAQDPALPWFWRSCCLEHTAMPMARLTSLLKLHDPLGLAAMQASVRATRDALPLHQSLANGEFSRSAK